MATRVTGNNTAAATAAQIARNANANNSTGTNSTGTNSTGTNSTTTASTAATNATAATATAATPPAQTEVVGNPNASGAQKVPTRKAEGFPKDFDMAKETSASASVIQQGATGEYISPVGSNWGFAGYTEIDDVKATDDGFQIDYSMYTRDEKEEGVMILYFPIREKTTGALNYLPLDILSMDKKAGTFLETVGETKGKDPVNDKDAFISKRTFKFSLKQINTYLKSTGLGVQVAPGDRLSLGGIMKKSTHRIANGASNSFEVPTPTSSGAQSPLTAQIGNATGQSIKAKDMPLDVTVKIPQEILDMPLSYSGKKVGDVLEGEITTRLESEYKGSVTKDQMGIMLDTAYELSELSEKAEGGDKAARKELDKLLGKGLTISPMTRHWMDEAGVALGNGGDASKVARDENGRPKLDTMVDAYSDVKDLTWTKISGAIRMRGNAQKAGHAEFKLGGGVLDKKTGIRQRTELGMSTVAGSTEKDLADVLTFLGNKGKSPYYSIAGHLIREAEELGLRDALLEGRSVWADVRQDRHKFEIADVKSGVKTELSLDTVTATTTRAEHEVNGKPQTETYYVVESELDHLQLDSANVTEAQSVSKSTAMTTTEQLSTFLDDQKAAVSKGDAEYESMKQPVLHGKEHVDEGSFRKTSDYKIFEKINKAVLDATTPGFDPGPARQKAAHFAELLGLVPPE